MKFSCEKIMKGFAIIVLILIVIDIVAASPLSKREITQRRKLQQQLHKKRDVSSLIKLRNSDEWIYGNNVPGEQADIVFSVFKIAPNDNYYFAYKQTDLQEREETGIYEFDPVINGRKLNVSGYYQYIRPDGKKQRVDYTSNDNGFDSVVTVE
ncbi:hypothetical protein PVAND_015940 [Polypedilum vanderplanki]|uniref:Uncharacterized protein n=1 Tax=Polypedilum vanderplanki TaxID=319348 RepID=A0A9J6BEP5_POLVA|nr:hypothetical protein PVAND_015940 [Polypedilum vanderplanki]